MPPITFTDDDFKAPDPDHDDPMVISIEVAEYGIGKVLIDQGSSVNILYWKTFQRMNLSEDLIVPYNEQIVGFSGEQVDTRGYVDLRTRIGSRKDGREVRVRFLLVEANTSYNVLLGRPCLNAFGAIVSTLHLAMKFPSDRGTICTVHADQQVARQCYAAGLRITPYSRPRKQHRSKVAMTDLDPRTNTEDRLQPEGETREIPVGSQPGQVTKIGGALSAEDEDLLKTVILENKDLFAWSSANMPGVHPDVTSHKLATFREARPVAQKKRKMGEERRKAVEDEVRKLEGAGFIKEIKYTTWLTNVVMVKKASGRWRMCTDFTDLNKACPKDAYSLPSIDRLVDGASGHNFLSFLDAYLGYNQIPMYGPDRSKTTFITDQANFCYEVMPFGLKNAGATYQRLMDRVFREQIGRSMEVYVDDMVVKSQTSEVCVFGVPAEKFLGFMLTARGIEANPDKCAAIVEMRSPKNLKEVQRLMGRLTSLARFLPRLTEKVRPILKIMKRQTAEKWDDQCELAFQRIKEMISSPPIMCRPVEGLPLQIYLSVSDDSISTALVQEASEQRPVYFISRVLQSAETRYQQIEKIALALLTAARRLRQYFQSHQVIVRTDHPIAKILRKPDLVGRMIAWSVELSEFGLKYEPRGSIKGQHLADFVAELQGSIPLSEHIWRLFVDGSSNKRNAGAGIVIEGPNGFTVEHSLQFKFKASNNQAEYEALIAGLRLAKDLGAAKLKCNTDSKLVVGQVLGEYEVRDDLLLQYYHKAIEAMKEFEEVTIHHIPRAENTRADRLSKLAEGKEKGQLKTIIRQTLMRPSTGECAAADRSADWIGEVRELLKRCEDGEEIRPTERRRALWFVIIGEDLYKRGFTAPLLKCLSADEAKYVMNEVHNGICGMHTGRRTMKARILRAGYFWPTMEQDCESMIRKCEGCQAHGNDVKRTPTELHSLTAPWPFAQWGMDIVGPFPVGRTQKKFILVAVDYFTKWVEAEALANITARQVHSFVWRNIICRFGLPHTIITDNGRQFIDKKLKDFYKQVGIRHVTSSVEHPQTNGQAEAMNKVVVAELKKRLGEAKGAWVDELPQVLWAYRCTPHGMTGETPFNLTYGTDAMMSVEVGEPTLRRDMRDLEVNCGRLREELDWTTERRERAAVRAEACKRMVARRYNAKVKPRSFIRGDLVWRKTNEARKKPTQGKLAPNWEGPFRVTESLQNGAYRLEYLSGKEIPNTWNASHLKMYYS